MLLYIKAPLSVQLVLDNLRKQWSSVFCVGTGEEAVRMELQFRRGLFQGDSLSPLLFCLSIAPISHALRETTGFRVPYLDSPVTHLFFMDDLKMCTRNSDILGDTLRVVDRVSRTVGMELGLRKCAVAHVKRRKYVGGEDYLLLEERKIELVAQRGTYLPVPWYRAIVQARSRWCQRTPDQGVRVKAASNLVLRSQLQAQGPCNEHLGCFSIPVLLCPGQVAPQSANTTRQIDPQSFAEAQEPPPECIH